MSAEPPRIGSPAWDQTLLAAGTSRARVDAALVGALTEARRLEPGGGFDELGEELSAPELSALEVVDELRVSLHGDSLPTVVAGHWLFVELRRSPSSLMALWSASMRAVEAEAGATRFWIDQLASFLAHGSERDALTAGQFLGAYVFSSRRPAPAIELFGEMLTRVPTRAWGSILRAAWEVDWRVKEPWLARALAEPSLHAAVATVLESALEKGELDRAEARERLAALDVQDPVQRARVERLLAVHSDVR